MNSAIAEPSLSRRLARLVGSLPVGPGDLADAERYVRDLLGSTAAGGATAPGRMLNAYGRRSTDLESIAFKTAALSHIVETDDLHRASVTHPGCVVIPVALLLGTELGTSGVDVLRGVLAGYEVMLRVGEALGPTHYHTFHNTATAGVFGSAAAAAFLLGLDEDGWVWALGNAGTQASGLWQFNEDAAMSKHLHAGHAAQAGLRAALLARQGFTGAERILEGERGFFAAFCPDAIPERVLAASPGWKARETSLKPYPSCRHTHPAIDAARELKEGLAGDPKSVLEASEVVIHTYPAALRLTDNSRPDNPYAAKFSIQYCVATTLLHGTPSLASFGSDRLRDPEVRSLLARTSVHVDPVLASAYPDRWGASVALQGSDRTSLRVVRAIPKGDPEDPLSGDELDSKVRGLGKFGGLSEVEVERMIASSKALVRGSPPFPPPGATRA